MQSGCQDPGLAGSQCPVGGGDADLLADRAGTIFALAATRDEASARKVQDRLSGQFTVADIFPPAADLPEGVPDAQLESMYGGVGGRRYEQLVDEIERRLAECWFAGL